VRLFISGAGGFIGRSVANLAVGRGHDVVELARSGRDPAAPRSSHHRTVVAGDLREPASWADSLGGCDAVVHLAGGIEATAATSLALIGATEQLVHVMSARAVDRLVLVSSISVYDYRSLRPGDVLDEATPLEPNPQGRAAYVQAKLAQERLAAAHTDLRTTVLRPGAVYGPGRLWNAGQAKRIGRSLGLAIERRARLKLTYVEHCAEAIVLAAEVADAAGAAANIVDDDLPTQHEFGAALARHGLDRPRTVTVPYRLASVAARAANGVTRGRLPLPGILVPSTLDAGYEPLEYPNEQAKRLLGWVPRYSLDEALARIAREAGEISRREG